jgi:hypothetical protein
MSDDEVEAVAAELAEAGDIPWPSGREQGTLKVMKERDRDRARLAIAALDRYRTEPLTAASSDAGNGWYRPPGDRRVITCRVEKIDGNRVYLMPDIQTCTGWFDIKNLSSESGEDSRP